MHDNRWANVSACGRGAEKSSHSAETKAILRLETFLFFLEELASKVKFINLVFRASLI